MEETATKNKKYYELGKLFPFDDSFYKNLSQLLELDSGNHMIELIYKRVRLQSSFAFESIISRYIVKFLYIFALYWQFSRLFTLKSIKKALSAFYSQKCNLYTCKLSIQVTIPSFLLLQKVIHTIHYEVVLPLKFSRIPYVPNHHIL